MSSKSVLTCHDCEKEVIINDIHGETETSDIKYCPLCGSTDNIDVVPKGTKHD